jgi:hypothetical protein
MSRILHELAQEGYQVTPEAINGMNPYGTGHIIRLGQYDVNVNRPLPTILYDLPFLPDEPEAELA